MIKWNRLVEAVIKAQKNTTEWDGDTEKQKIAKEALNEARNALRNALVNLEWNNYLSQGSARIDRGYLSINSMDSIIYLSINKRLRATLRCNSNPAWLQVISAEEAEEAFKKGKKNNKKGNLQYMVAREELIKDMQWFQHSKLESFREWEYCKGQLGGVFIKKGEKPSIYVGALGALKGAWGERWFEMDHIHSSILEEEYWDQKIYG